MPFRRSRQLSPRDQVRDETRLCFATATACLGAGVLGWGVNVVGSVHTPLPALSVVGGFYAVMGLARWWKWSRMKPDDVDHSTPGH